MSAISPKSLDRLSHPRSAHESCRTSDYGEIADNGHLRSLIDDLDVRKRLHCPRISSIARPI